MESIVLTVGELDVQAMNYLLSKGFTEDSEVEVTSYIDESGQALCMVLPL